MSFLDPLINASQSLVDEGTISDALSGIADKIQDTLHSVYPNGDFETMLHHMTVEGGDALPGMEIHDAQPDQVINAEADMLQATEALNGLYQTNALEHDTTVHVIDNMHADAGSHDTYAASADMGHTDTAYAGHDDASATDA